MKKFLFLIVCLLTVAGAYPVEPFFQYEEGRFSELELGVNADNQVVSVSVEKKGNDAVYTIYNPDFSVERTFTIKGAYTYSAEIKDNWDNPDAQHPNYTEPSEIAGYSMYLHEDVFAVQGLGQNRSKWCVFVDTRTWVDKDYHTGYEYVDTKVYDEDGNLIISFNSPNESYIYSNLYYYKFGEKLYLVNCIEDEREGYTETYNFYDLSSTSGINAPVAVKRSSRAYPNPLHQGKSFTIELSETAPEGSKVVVSDMNGSIVYRAAIQPGADKVIIPSRKLRNGNLVYSVYAGEAILEKGKIIVR